MGLFAGNVVGLPWMGVLFAGGGGDGTLIYCGTLSSLS